MTEAHAAAPAEPVRGLEGLLGAASPASTPTPTACAWSTPARSTTPAPGRSRSTRIASFARQFAAGPGRRRATRSGSSPAAPTRAATTPTCATSCAPTGCWPSTASRACSTSAPASRAPPASWSPALGEVAGVAVDARGRPRQACAPTRSRSPRLRRAPPRRHRLAAADPARADPARHPRLVAHNASTLGEAVERGAELLGEDAGAVDLAGGEGLRADAVDLEHGAVAAAVDDRDDQDAWPCRVPRARRARPGRRPRRRRRPGPGRGSRSRSGSPGSRRAPSVSRTR